MTKKWILRDINRRKKQKYWAKDSFLKKEMFQMVRVYQKEQEDE